MKTNNIIQQSKRAVKSFSLFTLLFSLAFASCSKEAAEELAPQTENTTFTLAVDELQTRATSVIAPARYVMEVWSADGTTAENVFENGTKNHAELLASSGNSFTVTLDKTKAYTCLFWADDNTAFNAASLKAVSLNSGKDMTEAYHAKVAVAKGKNPAVAVTLKRAVAKITFTETAAVKTSDDLALKLTNIYPQFSVLDGAATGTAAEWTKTIKPAATTGTIGTLYFFAKTAQELTELKFTYATETEKTVSNIPYQMNYATNIKGEYSNLMAATFTVTADDVWNTPDNDVNFGNEAKVGDYYYSDKTYSTAYDNTKTCIGIVFVVNADGKSGKIVGLDEPEANWNGGTNDAGKLTWGPTSTTNATNKLNGLVNMNAVKTAGSGTFTAYPAFAWVHSKNPADTDYSTATKGVWYLPATKELRQLYAAMSGLKWVDSGAVAANGEINDWGNNAEMDKFSNYAAARTAFNGLFTAAGKTPMDLSGYYWSSTENVDFDAWNVYFSNGFTFNDNKNFNGEVRAVLAF